MTISINHLTKHFKQGDNSVNVLNDLSLTIEKGEIIALLGKSGSGKSTLLSLLAGLEKPNEGTIEINQNDITKMNEGKLCDWRANNLGIVFQQFNLIPHLTALENVMLPLEITHQENIKTKAIDWLKLVGLDERANHFPSMLSGGEQQRIAIARALISGPSIVLADEPTGNLDNETGKKVVEILFKIIKEKKTTMIIVTHDEELASRADRLIRLQGGKCF